MSKEKTLKKQVSYIAGKLKMHMPILCSTNKNIDACLCNKSKLFLILSKKTQNRKDPKPYIALAMARARAREREWFLILVIAILLAGTTCSLFFANEPLLLFTLFAVILCGFIADNSSHWALVLAIEVVGKKKIIKILKRELHTAKQKKQKDIINDEITYAQNLMESKCKI